MFKQRILGMMAAAEKAEARAAQKALAGQAADTQTELATVTASLRQTEQKLSKTEKVLASARAKPSRGRVARWSGITSTMITTPSLWLCRAFARPTTAL
jgi:hypothetical protein